MSHKLLEENKILEVLSSWNFWGEGLDTGIKREISDKIKSIIFGVNKVISVFGIRRSGKSYVLRQVCKKLSEDYGKVNILYVNFEEASFPAKLTKEFLLKIYEVYKKYVSPNKKPVLILDEIQEVSAWERFVRTLNERNEAYVTISGSSAKLMSEELSTILSGRSINIEIFPLSFQEFLKFKEFRELYNFTRLKNLFLEYLTQGGFPEVVLEENREKKKEIVRNYFQTIIIKDVIKRFKVRNVEMLEALAKFIVSNPSALLSYRAISKSLDIPLKTVERYSKYLNLARLYVSLKKFSYSVKEQEKNPRKAYLIDNSFHTVLGFKLSENIGKLMENLVAIELLRRKSYFNPKTEIYYFKTQEGYEIDFLIKEGVRITKLVQVSYANSFDEVEEREIRGLLHAKELFKEHKPELLVITWDYEDEREVRWFGKEGKIKFVPLWKWLVGFTG